MEFERVGNDILGSFSGVGDIIADKMTMVVIVLGLLFIAGTMVKMRRRTVNSSFNFPIVTPPEDLMRLNQLRDQNEIKRIMSEGTAANLTSLTTPPVMPGMAQTTPEAQNQPADALNFVSTSDLKLCSVLDSSAHPILAVLENTVADLHSGYRVMAQLSLDKIITSRDDENREQAASALAGKTLEFVVIDKFGMAVLAAEQVATEVRSGDEYIARATLIEALRKAGVTFMEIPRDYSQSGLRQQINQILAKQTQSAQSA